MGWRTTYLLLGAATLVVLLIGSRWVIAAPPAAPSGEGAALFAPFFLNNDCLPLNASDEEKEL